MPVFKSIFVLLSLIGSFAWAHSIQSHDHAMKQRDLPEKNVNHYMPFLTQSPDTWVMELGTQKIYEFPVDSQTKGLRLSEQTLAKLQQMDPDGFISIDTGIRLKGETPMGFVKIDVPYAAPSFAAISLVLLADVVGKEQPVLQMGFSVAPVLKIHFRLKPGSEDEMEWDAPLDIYLQPHRREVTVQFINVGEGETHRVHVEGNVIAHQPDELEGKGSVYEGSIPSVLDVPQQTKKITYRCHIHAGDYGLRHIHWAQRDLDVLKKAVRQPTLLAE